MCEVVHIPLKFQGNHNRHEVKLHDPRDPYVREPIGPVTAESIAAAKAANAKERAALGLASPLPYVQADDRPTEEQWVVLDAHEAIWRLLDTFPAERLIIWVRNLNLIKTGQETKS